ncbi:MAG: type II toxin-antitoxin system VapC family toxin [Planctomycetota bacterium]|nr:type II toxin-antitoxin system VapC family toxin [Planctomycetota bacterium]MDA1249148.1 type II toxin-antitoxin system VapC family toxin [Planctomycetota bacterium]
MARIYIETTVVSFYYNARTEPEMIARQNWTRRWLDAALDSSDELVTSLAVESELMAGDFPNKADMLALASRLPLLDVNDAVIEAVEAYIANHVMPNNPGGDAFHLAVASFHRCDFLVTWNCQHIANANKFGHIRRVNGILGLGNPALVTPLELLNEDENDG